MQRLKITWFMFFLFFILSSESQAENQASVIKQVVSASHFDQHLQSITNFALAELDLRKEVMAAGEYKSLRNILVNAYNTELLQIDLINILQKHYDEKRFLQWLSHLQSPLFKKMNKLEVDATVSNAFEKMMEFAQTLNKNPPSSKREGLLRRLDKATSGTELALQGQVSVLRAFLTAINPTLPDNKKLNAITLEHILKTTRSQLEPVLHEIAMLTHLYTYRSVSDQELAEYVKIHESNVGTWISKLNQDAINNALTAAANRATKQITNHFENIKSI